MSCNSTHHACNPLGVCLRVIVNEKPLNLEKTTSIVLSVILINLCKKYINSVKCALTLYLNLRGVSPCRVLGRNFMCTLYIDREV